MSHQIYYCSATITQRLVSEDRTQGVGRGRRKAMEEKRRSSWVRLKGRETATRQGGIYRGTFVALLSPRGPTPAPLGPESELDSAVPDVGFLASSCTCPFPIGGL